VVTVWATSEERAKETAREWLYVPGRERLAKRWEDAGACVRPVEAEPIRERTTVQLGAEEAAALRRIAAAAGIYNHRPRGSTEGNVSGLLQQLAEAAVKWPEETTVRVYAAIRGVHEDTARGALASKAGHGPEAPAGNGEDA
jgi:hypothetical protein